MRAVGDPIRQPHDIVAVERSYRFLEINMVIERTRSLERASRLLDLLDKGRRRAAANSVVRRCGTTSLHVKSAGVKLSAPAGL